MVGSLLFIIFGWKVRDKHYGPSYPMNCPNCQNDVYFHAYKWRTWFHIFWMPLIPWKARRELICPACNAGVELGKTDFSYAKDLVSQTRNYQENLIPDTSYNTELQYFEDSVSLFDDTVDHTTPNPENQASPEEPSDTRGYE